MWWRDEVGYVGGSGCRGVCMRMADGEWSVRNGRKVGWEEVVGEEVVLAMEFGFGFVGLSLDLYWVGVS